MNGATAVPDVKITKLPSITRQKIIGRSQNFFRSFINDQISIRKSVIYTSILYTRTKSISLLTIYCARLTNIVLSDARAAGVYARRDMYSDPVSNCVPSGLFRASV